MRLHRESKNENMVSLALPAARNPLTTTLQLFIYIKQTQSWQQNLSELELLDCSVNFSKPCCCHFLSLALLNSETPSFKTFKIYLVMETRPHLLSCAVLAPTEPRGLCQLAAAWAQRTQPRAASVCATALKPISHLTEKCRKGDFFRPHQWWPIYRVWCSLFYRAEP